MKKVTLLSFLLLTALLLSNCTTPVTGVTPKPDVRPAVQSNKQIKESARRLHQSTQQVEKLNGGIQSNLDAAETELNKLVR